jgi:hypothetical protein
MQKNAISYFEYVEYAGICKNPSHDQQKNPWLLEMTEYAKKMLSSSADTRTPRLLTSNMYVHVHICNIYSAYIYMCV